MEFDLKKMESKHAHDLITSCIIPRPIAWVSTINHEGKTNIAPFSFFTCVSCSPPILAISVINRSDGSKKDTVINIEKVPEFVVNIVSVDLLSAMECSARQIPYGEDESYIKGICLSPSVKVKPYRIAEAKISFECTLEHIVRITEGAYAGNLILGQVQLLHVREDLIKNGRDVDWASLDALGKLSGNRYCTIRSIIESKTK